MKPICVFPSVSCESRLTVKSFQSGFSIVELMVAMVIGLVVSLAIYGVLTSSEGKKRTTTSINDIDQGGAYALYQLDKYIRSAGSGFSAGIGSDKAASKTYGCDLRAAKGGTQVLPGATYPAPFASISPSVRMAPAIIFNSAAGAGGDIIMVMSGNGGLAEVGTSLASAPGTATLNVKNVVGFRASDIALVVGLPGASMSPCMLEQIDASFVPAAGNVAIPLAGDYYQATIAGASLASFNTTAIALNLGQTPQFIMFGVGANNTLFKYDLLHSSSMGNDPNPSVFVDGVYQMQALYGINTGSTPSVTWVPPTGTYAASNLLSGTPAASALLNSIKAIKVGLIMRTSLPEKTSGADSYTSSTSIDLFSYDATNKITVTLSPLNYRYKVFESTIPLRNLLL